MAAASGSVRNALVLRNDPISRGLRRFPRSIHILHPLRVLRNDPISRGLRLLWLDPDYSGRKRVLRNDPISRGLRLLKDSIRFFTWYNLVLRNDPISRGLRHPYPPLGLRRLTEF